MFGFGINLSVVAVLVMLEQFDNRNGMLSITHLLRRFLVI